MASGGAPNKGGPHSQSVFTHKQSSLQQKGGQRYPLSLQKSSTNGNILFGEQSHVVRMTNHSRFFERSSPYLLRRIQNSNALSQHLDARARGGSGSGGGAQSLIQPHVLNANYYYLSTKNPQWNSQKNTWLHDLNECLLSQPMNLKFTRQKLNRNQSSGTNAVQSQQTTQNNFAYQKVPNSTTATGTTNNNNNHFAQHRSSNHRYASNFQGGEDQSTNYYHQQQFTDAAFLNNSAKTSANFFSSSHPFKHYKDFSQGALRTEMSSKSTTTRRLTKNQEIIENGTRALVIKSTPYTGSAQKTYTLESDLNVKPVPIHSRSASRHKKV